MKNTKMERHNLAKQIILLLLVLFGVVGLFFWLWKGDHKVSTEFIKSSNQWREFNFDNIEGETPGKVFGKTVIPAFGKYRIWQIKVFADIGFILGDNSEELRSTDNINDIRNVDQLEKAYIFRSTDHGRTFSKQELGHGSARSIIRVGNTFYLSIYMQDTKNSELLRSNDRGETWQKADWFPWAALDEQTYLRGINPVEISRDQGQTWEQANRKLQTYSSKYEKDQVFVYEGKLVVLDRRSLVFFDPKTNETETVPLKIPEGKIAVDPWVDKESGELYLTLFDDIVGNPRTTQGAIWFPLKDEIVKFEEKLEGTVFLQVAGNYIGGFTKIENRLMHVWTLDRGKTWHYEMLDYYFWDTAKGYGNGQIWMQTFVRGKEGLPKGTYLAIGTLKDYQ